MCNLTNFWSSHSFWVALQRLLSLFFKNSLYNEHLLLTYTWCWSRQIRCIEVLLYKKMPLFTSETPSKKIQIHKVKIGRFFQIPWDPPYQWTVILQFYLFSCPKHVGKDPKVPKDVLKKYWIIFWEPLRFLKAFLVRIWISSKWSCNII
jgi:hypothetical protein